MSIWLFHLLSTYEFLVIHANQIIYTDAAYYNLVLEHGW